MSSATNMDYIGFGYSLVVLFGGVMGYLKAGSISSLISGITFGVAAFLGARQVSANPRNVNLALAVSVALMLVMGFRFSKSGKFMPAGMVSVISLLNAVRYAVRLAA